MRITGQCPLPAHCSVRAGVWKIALGNRTSRRRIRGDRSSKSGRRFSCGKAGDAGTRAGHGAPTWAVMGVSRNVGSGSIQGRPGRACRRIQHRRSSTVHHIHASFITRCPNSYFFVFRSHPMSTPSPKRSPSPGPEPSKKRRRGATRLSCAECRRSLCLCYHLPSLHL